MDMVIIMAQSKGCFDIAAYPNQQDAANTSNISDTIRYTTYIWISYFVKPDSVIGG